MLVKGPQAISRYNDDYKFRYNLYQTILAYIDFEYNFADQCKYSKRCVRSQYLTLFEYRVGGITHIGHGFHIKTFFSCIGYHKSKGFARPPNRYDGNSYTDNSVFKLRHHLEHEHEIHTWTLTNYTCELFYMHYERLIKLIKIVGVLAIYRAAPRNSFWI